MKKNIIFFLILLFAFSSVSYSYGQQPITKMQSLYIYNFIKNIKWQNLESSYVVGVFADNAIVDEIKNTIGVRKFNGKAIEVKKITTPTEASNCQIVFVTKGFNSTLSTINTSTILKNTLLVSEEGTIAQGESIAFIMDNSKLKFKINEPVCKSSGLQISATLLSLSQ